MTAGRGRYSAGEGTRVLLIETAERLFARRGYEAVTLAEIRSAAGQHNASVISYYFGSKENLLRAVFEHRLPTISADRAALVERLTATGNPLTTRDVLWILVQPPAPGRWLPSDYGILPPAGRAAELCVRCGPTRRTNRLPGSGYRLQWLCSSSRARDVGAASVRCVFDPDSRSRGCRIRLLCRSRRGNQFRTITRTS
ncbi:helix-turn-helix domain-containing protein [Nocardia sp. NPDC051750]|uniref:helix-turn-helix domain-containing protein n=1 Tax=Nocardia sp. NPDC051750 TaxID=3364325 RepID=UPI0037AC0409